MKRDEKKEIEKYIQELKNRIQLASNNIKECNYGLAYKILNGDIPKVDIVEDAADSYKPIGKETKNSLIYKGIQWLEDKFSEDNQSSGRGEWIEIRSWDFDSMEEMIRDFRKTMEED